MEDEGLRVVNSCHLGTSAGTVTATGLIVPEEEGTANSVPAAAVIQRSQALFGFIGRKGCVGGARKSGVKFRSLTPKLHSILRVLEDWRGDWNSWCSSEMRRDHEEDQWRRRVSGQFLTLRHEGQGSKRD